MIARTLPPRILIVITALTLARLASAGDDPPASKKAAAEKDYGAELPRVPPRSPEEARKAIEVRPGFQVQLVAAEPLLRSPVAMDWDEDGRLYVVEYPEYNQEGEGQSPPRGCVRRLDDHDGDGVYDKSTLFADDVSRACAVGCWDGGVFVGSPPDLLYLKDTNGDGKADVRRVVFTGFGRDKAGEGMINSFRWGMDQRYRIATSGDGGEIRRGDRPGDKLVSVRGYHLLLDPSGETFELTGGGGQHGMTLDDWGRAFVCGNSDPFHLVMYDSRYLARNPYLTAPPAAVNIAPAGKYTKLNRISPVEPWRALRTRLRSQGVVPGSDEGGSPSGFFTGGSGVTVYRGDAFPREFHGNLFVGDVANNVIHRALAVADGRLVAAKDAEAEGHEFLASRDNTFRPVQMASGPDGALWVIDMCRELIEGAAFLPPQILKHMDVSSGADRGRIWRIVPDGTSPRRMPRLGRASTTELVALLEHPNGWHRDTASRLLYQRQDRAAAGPLRELAAQSESALARASSLHALAGLGMLDSGLVLSALDDRDPHVRAQALRLAEPFCAFEPRVRTRLLAMTADSDAMVRYQLAFSLGALPGNEPAAPLAVLATREGGDRWMGLAILSSTARCAGALFGRLAGDASFLGTSGSGPFLAALATAAGASGKPGDVAAVVEALEGPLSGREREALAREVVLALIAGMPASSHDRLLGKNDGRTAAILAAVLADARATASRSTRPSAARAAAVRKLRFAPFGDVAPLLTELLGSRQPPDVQAAAVETLARFDEPRVAHVLLEAWPEMSPKLRATTLEALFARAAWINAFLDAVESKTVSRSDLDPARLELITKTYPDPAVRARAAKLLSGSLVRRQDVVAAYQKALAASGDREKGKAVFKAQCATCHRLEGVGTQVGADLSAIRDRGLDAVLLNILDPNREVQPQYLSYTLATVDGRVLTGMITAETANSVTIRKPDGGEETVLRLQVDGLRSTGLSFMPEGLEKQIDPAAMADLLAYLNSIR